MDTLTMIRQESAKYPRDYGGYWPGTDGYLGTGVAHTRDSDALEKSNYRAALARLNQVASTLDSSLEPGGGYVLEHYASSWGPGWIETLWVADVPALVDALLEIRTALEDYPVLDEEDFCEREHEAFLEEIDDWIRPVIQTALDEAESDLEIPRTTCLQQVLFDVHSATRGDDVPRLNAQEWLDLVRLAITLEEREYPG